jgi:hypothetical protein
MKNTLSDQVEISQVSIDGESFYKVSNSDVLRPFFMSIVSDSNHWMFISSNGGLSVGRKNADHAVFPYYTDDKITESAENTGSKSIFWVEINDRSHLWEPFSQRQEGIYNVHRNLYKNIKGNKLLFEEVNLDLQITYRYQWNSSNLFGFVRLSQIINHSQEDIKISLCDGIQNIVPAGVGSDLQNQSSNLVDAYKRSELLKDSGLGIYALSAIIVDKAEPSEALKANVVWSLGFDNPYHLLSSLQLSSFRKGNRIREEVDIKAEKGAYFIVADIELSPNNRKEWMIIADVNKNHSAVVSLSEKIKNEDKLNEIVHQDIEYGTKRLIKLVASSDGLQCTADQFRDTRHFSNTLFNIMRGGIFDDNYQIEKRDFMSFLSAANSKIFNNVRENIETYPDLFSLSVLKDLSNQNQDSSLKRLCLEYMPLKFSRRHGDPSRPWNKFSINTRSEIDGSKILDYEGNWRDIFQNWEALAHSYPAFAESMIHKFLNASTFEGYNPYRVTKDGFDWETIEPDNPWSYIGYWGDHQIIYLLKFLEFLENHAPGRLEHYFDKDLFVYANVPYQIKSYADILLNPKDTISFDHELDQKIRERKSAIGADGALLQDENGDIHNVNFIEKILAAVLSKISNFIPEGGIWMNTQRPEWNDANNALVGNGVSMVTLCYLRRFLKFFKGILDNSGLEGVKVSSELVDFYKRIREVLSEHQLVLSGKIQDTDRKLILDGLGQAGSDFRQHIYKQSFWSRKRTVTLKGLRGFVDLSLEFIDHSITANKRTDHLYHAYNLMTVKNNNAISISHLSEMLEGQVAVLSAGKLNSTEALELLNGLKKSKLFREDQFSYLLYPNKELPRFLEKNIIPKEEVANSKLLSQLVNDRDLQIIEKDINGDFHFNGDFKNANDLDHSLSTLMYTKYSKLVEQERGEILEIFEDLFNHKAFTGRSGTFYGYEGLGSIYWHMVSKLQLAVQECCLKAIRNNESEDITGGLLEHYYEINEGIGVHKSPSLYGAFPTDPYSHTPAGKGAQQPGMTGQVKEDILSRFGELGVFVKAGSLFFDPCLLRKDEFLQNPETFEYVDVRGQVKQIQMNKGSLCFTYCQVPILYYLGNETKMEVQLGNELTSFDTLNIDQPTSQKIFERTGEVFQINVHINQNILK